MASCASITDGTTLLFLSYLRTSQLDDFGFFGIIVNDIAGSNIDNIV